VSGLNLLRELNSTGRAIPSLLITGLPDAGIADEARELGVLEVLTKPIDWEKLLKLVAFAVQ
jgi:FixJ family two-component response regulator